MKAKLLNYVTLILSLSIMINARPEIAPIRIRLELDFFQQIYHTFD